ncbi:MAG TPA: pyridoxamine 5'-phosphate oxidase family protein [Cyclobacteriaceae bacterium]|jgi:pyridoxamine 5'-phosphate oxidase|nr:pyridoxamine 5'-phosphate oxidase family protein [Cyclobacteriaceae bacterium]HMV89597.1 pyridoxamine 5'-phosphate oxidase family protein [Cyclobacteriaceae bacterium]HMW99439.1 pyridoxamine 5'-phosphate oxidase family protein [Cyclobacteriaceae bacterium]HNC28605.1 pyridoxamine 5'-phosphate oxidase family protein [Cyclobacteriaceae bacterium]HND42030.1 pyridoxamine 5'-phosphate oxidase family protein [Cyclobacteriaceae bacterium]
MRREYSNAPLDETALAPNPLHQFDTWFKQALEVSAMEPNAMHLGTVSRDGRPSLRVVLLKGIENDKFVFYTNLKSGKAKELANNKACAATFYWPELARQVRIEGDVLLIFINLRKCLPAIFQ